MSAATSAAGVDHLAVSARTQPGVKIDPAQRAARSPHARAARRAARGCSTPDRRRRRTCRRRSWYWPPLTAAWYAVGARARRPRRRAAARCRPAAATMRAATANGFPRKPALTGSGAPKSMKLRLRSALSSLTRRKCEKPYGIERMQHQHANAGAARYRPEKSSSSSSATWQPEPQKPSAPCVPEISSSRPGAPGSPTIAKSIDSSSPSAPRSVGCTCRETGRAAQTRRQTKLVARFGVALRRNRRPGSSRRHVQAAPLSASAAR